MSYKKSLFVSGLAVLLLPACSPLDWVKGKAGGGSKPSVSAKGSGATVAGVSEPTGDVLLMIDGKPAVTTDSFEAFFYQFLESQPKNLKKLLPMMPDAKYNVFTGMVNEEVVLEWAKRNKIKDRPAYQEEFRQVVRMIERRLAIKFFEMEHKAKVSSGDVKKFYEDNKETMPGLYKVRRGVDAEGVGFNDSASAKAFYDVVRKSPGEFANEAKKVKKTVKDFKVVTDMSVDVDKPLKDKILGMTSFPSVKLFEINDKTIWVVKAKSEQKAQYVPFDDVKDDLEEFIEKEKMTAEYAKILPALKDEYKVTENRQYFDSEKEKIVGNIKKMAEAEQAKAPGVKAVPAPKSA